MQKIIVMIESVTRRLGQAVSWLALLMVLMTAYNVVVRYFFSYGIAWQQEIVRFGHATLFMLAAAYTLAEDKHVRIDVCYQRFSEKQKALVDLVGTLILLFPVCFAVFYFSYDYVVHSWELHEASSEYGGLPGVFLLKSCIWGFAVTMALQGLAMTLRSIEIIWGRDRG